MLYLSHSNPSVAQISTHHEYLEQDYTSQFPEEMCQTAPQLGAFSHLQDSVSDNESESLVKSPSLISPTSHRYPMPHARRFKARFDKLKLALREFRTRKWEKLKPACDNSKHEDATSEEAHNTVSSIEQLLLGTDSAFKLTPFNSIIIKQDTQDEMKLTRTRVSQHFHPVLNSNPVSTSSAAEVALGAATSASVQQPSLPAAATSVSVQQSSLPPAGVAPEEALGAATLPSVQQPSLPRAGVAPANAAETTTPNTPALPSSLLPMSNDEYLSPRKGSMDSLSSDDEFEGEFQHYINFSAGIEKTEHLSAYPSPTNDRLSLASIQPATSPAAPLGLLRVEESTVACQQAEARPAEQGEVTMTRMSNSSSFSDDLYCNEKYKDPEFDNSNSSDVPYSFVDTPVEMIGSNGQK